jgi:hypothetical protein
LVLKIVEQEVCSTVLKTWSPVPVISSLVLIKLFIFLAALKLIEAAQYRSFFIQGFSINPNFNAFFLVRA